MAGLGAAVYYGVKFIKEQKNKEIAEAEALLRQQEQELASKSPVRRVRRLVQRLKGNA